MEATGLVQLSYESTATVFPQMLLLYPYIDDNTNSLFVPGAVGWVGGMVDHIFYNNDTLDFPNQTSFWLRLDKDDLNNRVFAQAKFMNGMYFGDMLYSTSNSGDWDRWLAIWDYNGRAIDLPIQCS